MAPSDPTGRCCRLRIVLQAVPENTRSSPQRIMYGPRNIPEERPSAHALECIAMPASAELDRLRIVLVAARNPLNIGASARAMSNFGCRHLRVVSPYEAGFREARSAVGASAVFAAAEEYKSVPEAVA